MPRYTDLTAELMGDPAAAHRRAPTFEEMRKPNQHCGFNLETHVRRKEPTNAYLSWETGESRPVADLHRARNAVTWFSKRGMRATMRKQPDGTFLITRVE
jgi:hypothetical protein